MITDMITKISRQRIEALPNYKKRTPKEWSSACPVCGGDPARDTDRFRFWPDTGNYWCRKCELSGFVSDTDYFTVTDEMRQKAEAMIRERNKQDFERQKSVLEQLQSKRNDLVYHRNFMNDSEIAGQLWLMWGITQELAEQFKIGYCNACPTYPQSASFTIPFYSGGNLVNLRHRLIKPGDTGKYRPEIAGLKTNLFNSDILNKHTDFILLVEGEFKTVFLSAYYDVVGISGVQQFQPEWGEQFRTTERVFICFDPGTEQIARKTAKLLTATGNDVRIITLPHKPDDFFSLHNGTKVQFDYYLKNGRKI